MAIRNWMGSLKYLSCGRQWVLRSMSTLAQEHPTASLAPYDLADTIEKIDYARASQGSLTHANSAKVKFLGVFIGFVDDSKRKRQYEKALEKRRRVIHRLRQLQKQRKESWEKEVERLALNAFTRGYRKTLNTLRSGSKAKQAIFDKATELGMKAALTLTDEQPLMTSDDLKRLLEQEEDHFARLGWDYLPESVKIAYENLMLSMEEACEELKSQADSSRSRQVPPTGMQYTDIVESCSSNLSSASVEQSISDSARLSTEESYQYPSIASYSINTGIDLNYCYEKVMERLADPGNLHAAYGRIKSKLQFLSGKIDEDWNDLSMSSFDHIAQKLRTGTYQFSLVTQIHVRKPGKEGSVRTILVVNPRDQIVVEVIRAELEKIYEPMFLVNAHRYKSARSCHMALRLIKNSWKGTTWFLHYKSPIGFGKSEHENLLRILSVRIKDEEFLDLVQRMFKTSMISLGDRGSRLSALLCNIFYHQLDMEVTRMQAELNTGSNRRKASPVSRSGQALGCEDELGVDSELAKAIWEISLQGINQLNGSQVSPYTRVRYVRYAEEFLFGITGSKALALDVSERVQKFLRRELKTHGP